MKLPRVLILLLLAIGQAAATSAATVTTANLLESERFWPYRVTLTEAFSPEGRDAPLPVGSLGVLIRVEPGGVARIDFSAEGKFPVPIQKTDLVENANRIRRGELEKELPNFVHAIGARLLDSSGESPQGLRAEATADRAGFLCVFADPDDAGFAALAEALAPLEGRHDVATLLFPQGSHPDKATHERLRALDWRVPFVYHHLSEPYTRTLLEEGAPLPTLLLQTNEGRVVFQDAFSPALVPRLSAALDAAFGEPTPIAGTSRPETAR